MRTLFDMHYKGLIIIVELHDVVLNSINMIENED